MSEIKVNKLSPRSGTAVTLGDSGDTFTIPSGATLAIAGSVTGFTSAGIDDNATSVAITINSSEQVGIGTTSPDHLLHISASSSNAQLKLQRTGSATASFNIAASSDSLAFSDQAASTERMRITSTGLGIGTSSPGYPLEINSSAQSTLLHLVSTASTFSQITFANTGSNDSIAIGAENDDLKLRTDDGVIKFFTNENSEKMRLNNTGLGIGTTSPSQPLTVSSSSTNVPLKLITTGSQTYSGIMFESTQSDDYVGIGVNVEDLKLRTDDGNITFCVAENTEKMRLSSSGRLGIGTTSPSSYYANHLVVDIGSTAQSGITIVADSSNQAMLAFADGTSGDTRYRGYLDYNHSNDSLAFASAGTERMRIDSSGEVLVGKTSTSNTTAGVRLGASGVVAPSRTADAPIVASRLSTDGTIIELRKDGTEIGSIGTENWSLTSPSNHPQLNIRSTITPDGSKYGGQINLSLGTGSNSGSGNTSTQYGDILGNINFNGQGTDYSFQGGGIEVKQTTPLGQTNRTDAGCDMIFKVISAGGTGYTEKLRIKSSGGITFNGDTSVHNALDDYEEGTWTPTWTGSSSTSVASGNYGYYTKIGNVVTVHFGAVLSSASNSYYQVTNLPFQSNIASGSCIGAGQEYGHTGYMYRNQIGDNSTTAHIVSYQNNVVANAYLQLSLTYRTD